MNDRAAPPASTSPAGDGGLEASAAEAVPVGVTEGTGSAASTSPAPPPLVACKVSLSCCRPAETVAALSDALSERLAGFSTATGFAEGGVAETAVPLLASVPEAEAENVSVPLPETS